MHSTIWASGLVCGCAGAVGAIGAVGAVDAVGAHARGVCVCVRVHACAARWSSVSNH